MKIKKHKSLLFYIQVIALILLSSCSKIESIDVEHSFQSAINVEQNITDFDKVEFESFDDLNLGFFKGNVWIKLEITNKNQPQSYLIINNDKINRNYAFYKLDSLDGSLKVVNHIVDKSKQDHRTFNFPNPNFKVDLGSNEQAVFLIVASSDGRTVNATPELISMTSYYSLVNENMVWSIVFLGFIVFLLLINIYQWSIHKHKIYFYYTFYILCTFAMYLGLEGHLYKFELKHITIDHIVFLSIRLWVLSLIMYTFFFLEVQVAAPKYYKLIKWLLLVVLGGTTLYQFIFYSSSIAHLHYFENTLSFLWMLIILIVVFISARKRKLELKYYLIPLFCFLLFTTIGLIDGHFQVFPGSPFIYIKLGTIIEFIGFTYFMSLLIKRKIKRAEDLESKLDENRQKLIVASKIIEEKDKLLSSKNDVGKTNLIGVFKLLENSLSTENEWDEFKLKFKELNPTFLEQLLIAHPDLSKSEIRLLTLTKIGYSLKEIATILSIAPDSVKKAKSRVRKKMNLSKDIVLNDYLLKF